LLSGFSFEFLYHFGNLPSAASVTSASGSFAGKHGYVVVRNTAPEGCDFDEK
jgi:hypothetical protein